MDEKTIYSSVSVRKWGFNIPNGPSNLGIGLAKVNTLSGDTLFVKRVLGWTGLNGSKLVKSFEGNLVIASNSVGDTVYDSRILVQKVDTNGNPVWVLPLVNGLQNPQIKKLLPTPDGGTFILGSDLSTIGGFMDWLLIKVGINGQLEWSQRYSGGTNWYCEANNMEPLRNGNYLISGMAERSIWSVEIDANGNQVDQHTFWFGSVPNLVFDAVVRQTSYKSFAVSGTFESNPATAFFGKFDSLKTKVWGGETGNKRQTILTSNKEGSVFSLTRSGLNNDTLFFDAVTNDSIQTWHYPLPRSLPVERSPIINDMTFDGLGNAVICGSAKRNNSNRDELFFMKISGIGLPYDPFTDTVLTYKREKTKVIEIKAYPNPTKDQVWFSGMKEAGQLLMFAPDGRLLFNTRLEHGMPVSLASVPSGLYYYRLNHAGHWLTGKILKE